MPAGYTLLVSRRLIATRKDSRHRRDRPNVKTITDPREMMCGAYLFEMANADEASRIISRFSGCPNWRVISKGPNENEVFVLAVELKGQRHGDFSEDNNSLVREPGLIGARAVRFTRIHNWEELLPDYRFTTGYAASVPCGSSCQECPSFMSPCRGCPAVFEM